LGYGMMVNMEDKIAEMNGQSMVMEMAEEAKGK
jgi:hypothetical protein